MAKVVRVMMAEEKVRRENQRIHWNGRKKGFRETEPNGENVWG